MKVFLALRSVQNRLSCNMKTYWKHWEGELVWLLLQSGITSP